MLHLGERLYLALLEMFHFALSMKNSANPLNKENGGL